MSSRKAKVHFNDKKSNGASNTVVLLQMYPTESDYDEEYNDFLHPLLAVLPNFSVSFHRSFYMMELHHWNCSLLNMWRMTVK